MAPPLVDTHFHIFDRSTPLLSHRWNPNGEEARIEDILVCFATYGVTHGVISTASIYGFYNDGFRDALARFPNLRATANMPLDAPQRLFERMSSEGFVGIRLLWRPLDEVPDLHSEEWQRLLHRCADHGWHVHLTDRPERIGTTIQTLEEAGVRIVVDHMGMIDTAAGIDDEGFREILAAIDRGRTWVKLSGAFRYRSPGNAVAAARSLIDAAGWERLMWGSDWPFVGHMETMTYREALASLEWITDSQMRRRVAADTALDFYFRDS